MIEDELIAMRHSCEHVLHIAVSEIFKGSKKAMGPATEDGFYHDFEYDKKVTVEDFPALEKRMKAIIVANLPITRKEISIIEAKKIFKNNEYKLDWISQIQDRGEKATIYIIGDPKKPLDVDLCKGPHVSSTSKIGAFKLLSVAGAYWHGDEKNKMLVRIYGTAFPTMKELDEFLLQKEESANRDHRKLGKALDLFVFSDLVGKGLPLLTPRGTVIRKELEKFVYEEETKRGYKHVITPPLAKVDLYKKSGHFPYYKDTMYPVMKVDDEELILRPMTCPHHFMLYSSRPRSYKELPLRFAEISPQFRYEKSGELSGLTRVRMFCLADAHIFCTKDQATGEIKAVLELIDYANSIFGLKKGIDYRYRLSLGDRSDNKKYYKDDLSWDKAEAILRNVLVKTESPYFEAEKEAAFYGPKIDVQMKKINGQEETAFTVQYDFVMPKRFDLTYIDAEGKEQEPVVIHRSSIGAFERTMAFLIEHYNGAFPLWLSPDQVVIIPINDSNLEYANEIKNILDESQIRNYVDSDSERMQNKIRKAQGMKVPYMIIVGNKETESRSISVRYRDGEQKNGIPLDDFVDELKYKIKSRSL